MDTAQTPSPLSLPLVHAGGLAARVAVPCPVLQWAEHTENAKHSEHPGLASHAESAINTGSRVLAITLPSDVIDAIADALIAIDVGAAHASATSSSPLSPHASVQRLCAPTNHTHSSLALALTTDAQRILRTLAQVSRQWRRALLHRAWRSVELTGAAAPDARTIHMFAGQSARRLAVPWGAMAAPVSWLTHTDGCTKHHRHETVGVSADSRSQPAGGTVDRLDAIFGSRVWPRVEHLDMSFMPLISYHGLAAHIRRTMPRLATMRIGGYVPATALADILGSGLQLRALEISASV
ncbi:hypothetical protein FBU59_005555, partial [Linderina macrospora]